MQEYPSKLQRRASQDASVSFMQTKVGLDLPRRCRYPWTSGSGANHAKERPAIRRGKNFMRTDKHEKPRANNDRNLYARMCARFDDEFRTTIVRTKPSRQRRTEQFSRTILSLLGALVAT